MCICWAVTWIKFNRSFQAVFLGYYLFTYLLTYLFTYLRTLWRRVLLEKPTGFQLVKKFPTFCGTRKFITAFTSTRHLSLSWGSSILSIPPHPPSWRSILILFSHLRLVLPSGFFPSGFLIQKRYIHLSFPPIRATYPTHFILGLISRTRITDHSAFIILNLIFLNISLFNNATCFVFPGKTSVPVVVGTQGGSEHQL